MLFRLDTNYHFPLCVCILRGSRNSKHIISFNLNINWTRELRTLHSTRPHQPLVQDLRLGLWLFVVNSFTLSWLPDRMERGRVAQILSNELTGNPPPLAWIGAPEPQYISMVYSLGSGTQMLRGYTSSWHCPPLPPHVVTWTSYVIIVHDGQSIEWHDIKMSLYSLFTMNFMKYFTNKKTEKLNANVCKPSL